MIRKDLHHNILVTQVLDPAVVTADATSAVIDRQGYEACEFVWTIGESGDTLSGSVYMDLIIEAGDASDGSDAAAVTDKDALLGVSADLTAGKVATIDAAAEDDVVVTIGYRGPSRYVRAKIDVTGTHTNGTPAGILAIQAGAEVSPATADV